MGRLNLIIRRFLNFWTFCTSMCEFSDEICIHHDIGPFPILFFQKTVDCLYPSRVRVEFKQTISKGSNDLLSYCLPGKRCILEEAWGYFVGSPGSTKDVSAPNSRSTCNTKRSERAPCDTLVILYPQLGHSFRGKSSHGIHLEGGFEGRQKWCRRYRRFWSLDAYEALDLVWSIKIRNQSWELKGGEIWLGSTNAACREVYKFKFLPVHHVGIWAVKAKIVGIQVRSVRNCQS